MHRISKDDWAHILRMSLVGAVIGFCYGFAEHYFKPENLVALAIRAPIGGFLILGTINIFEILTRKYFRRRTFMFLLIIKTFTFSIIIIVLLGINNGINDMIVKGDPFLTGIEGYYFRSSNMVFVNLITLFVVILSINIIIQINSLHRKGELRNYIMGRYHQPKEVERIFLFIDMSSSTPIAERLGHIKYGALLQEYYLDVAKAANSCKGETYDYIGDEVIISWPIKGKHNIEKCIKCISLIRSILQSNKEKYLEKYDVVPGFRAGAHGGKVLVMWVGDDKKEIIYVGDVLNTTKRIQSECKRFDTDFLISGDLVNRHPGLDGYSISLVDDILLKGKSKKVEIYGVGSIPPYS